MNSNRIIIQKLQRLQSQKVYLNKLTLDLLNLKEERGLKGISYDDVRVDKGTISDTTGNLAVNIVEKEEKLEREIRKVRCEVELIEDALLTLREDERKVIVGRYIQYKEYHQIAREIGISESTAKRKRKSGIEMLVLAYFGMNA